MKNAKVWFITGAGRGMGVDFAKAALAVDRFGRIDVLVNNAASFRRPSGTTTRAERSNSRSGAPRMASRAAIPPSSPRRSSQSPTRSGLRCASSPALTPSPRPSRWSQLSSSRSTRFAACRRRSRSTRRPRPTQSEGPMDENERASNRPAEPKSPSAQEAARSGPLWARCLERLRRSLSLTGATVMASRPPRPPRTAAPYSRPARRASARYRRPPQIIPSTSIVGCSRSGSRPNEVRLPHALRLARVWTVGARGRVRTQQAGSRS
jgi:hypothetical protein